MKASRYLLLSAVLCSPVLASTIHYNGKEFLTIEWDETIPMFGEDRFSVSGTAGGIDVFFSSDGLESDETILYDYSTDAAFDAVDFGGASMESLTLFGGEVGTSRLSFSSAIGEVLIFVGSPNESTTATQFGASIWDFQDDSVDVEIVDNELAVGGLRAVDGVVSSSIANQISGIIGVSGEMSILEWLQNTSDGRDKMQITFAISPIPAPSSGLALLISAGMLGRRRR
ncbi:MAG: PEP-CTERM sorting domain-containing protein [Phycisphaerales bacterium]